METLIWQTGLASFLIALLTTKITIIVFTRLGWLDDPRKKAHPKVIHSYPVPRGGGIPIFLGVFLPTFWVLNLNSQLLAIFIASFLLLVFGLWDDLADISPYLRLGINLIASLIVIASGIGIHFLTNPLDGIIHLPSIYLWGPATLFWLVWCTNIIGWSGGVEGQLPGLVIIASLVIGKLSLRFISDTTQWPVVTLAAALAGAQLGFLIFNFYPQKIMPGYSGKSLAGFLLGVLAILSGAKLATLALTLALPMVDGIWAIIRRLKRGQLPVWGDANHFHHLLLRLGIPKPVIAVFYWVFAGFLGLLVLQLNSQQKFWGGLMVFLGISALILFLQKKDRFLR